MDAKTAIAPEIILGRPIETPELSEQEARSGLEAIVRTFAAIRQRAAADKLSVALQLTRWFDGHGPERLGLTMEQIGKQIRLSKQRISQLVTWGRVWWAQDQKRRNGDSAIHVNPGRQPFGESKGKLPPPPLRPGHLNGLTDHQARELGPVAHDPDLVAKVLEEAREAAELDAERRAIRARAAGRHIQPDPVVTRRNVREAVQKRVPPSPADQSAEYQARVERVLGHLRSARSVLDLLDEGGLVGELDKILQQVQGLKGDVP